MTDALLFNGEAVAPDLTFHRGFTYGDGVFRTCLVHDSHVVDLDRHVDKVIADAAQLHLGGVHRDVLLLEARALAAGRARGVLKLLLLRAGGERGYRSAGQQADRLLCRYAAPGFPARAWEQGIDAARTGFRLAAQPALAGIKHLNRLEQVLASRQLPAEAAEGIVDDDAGRPLSGTRTNLFWSRGTVLRTPRLDRCGVAGVLRDKVLAAAPGLGLAVDDAPGSWDELLQAEEAFVTNSVVGIWPLASLGERRWDAPGPVTRRVADHVRHPRLVGR